MSNVVVSVSARTDIGRQRAGNEDALLVADLASPEDCLDSGQTLHTVGERGTLLVVSDGMGGAAAGEIASEFAVTTVRDALLELSVDVEVSDRLTLAAQSANARIWNHAQENPELTGMGATLTAVLVQDALAYIAQVGDSRAYLMRGEEIKQLTKDQSLAQLLIEAGMVDSEQAARVPQNVIMQALGTQPEVRVTVTSVQLSSRDGLLVCSDGLSNKVADHEMLEAVRQSPDLGAACKRLVEMANERGGEDNITVIIARFDGERLTEGDSIDGSVRAISEDFFSEEAMSSISGQMNAAAAPAPAAEGASTTITAPVVGPGETESSLSSPAVESETPEPGDPGESKPHPRSRMSYNAILFLALISLLLLAVAGYLFWVYYLKQPAEPLPVNTTSQL